MKALVLGCGSIGLRHIGHLRQLGGVEIEAADPNPAARSQAEAQYGIPVHSAADDALETFHDAVLVCTPAHLHVGLTSQALDAGAHVFVEKPLSTSLDGVEALARKAKAKGRIVQVGYNLRYHPAMKAMKRMVEAGHIGRVLSAHAEFGLYLAKWWPGRDYRQSYMASATLGGDLLLDASHEIDSLLWLLGPVEQVTAFGGRLSTLEIPGLDLVKVVMKMRSGAVGSLQLDCLQPTYTRMYSLIGEGSALRWDCPRGRADTSLGRLLQCASGDSGFRRVALRGRPGDTYREEVKDFLECVKRGGSPLVGLDDAASVLRVVEAIREAMQTGRVVGV